jgi:CelD/BcsL family acetyltransferase involved in cellulose biosynthesis
MKLAWLGRTGRLSPALTDPRFAAFFADVAEGNTRGASCEVVVLKSNGEPAGYAIDVTCGGRRAAHVIVHDARFDDFGAGVLLLQEWIRGACAHGIATFDLLAPAYAYKTDWADGAVHAGDFALGLTLRGSAFARIYLGFARGKLKTALESASAFRRRLIVGLKSLQPAKPTAAELL